MEKQCFEKHQKYLEFYARSNNKDTEYWGLGIENESYLIVDFSEKCYQPIIELAALGSMIDLDYFLSTFPDLAFDKQRVGHLFYYLIELSPELAITKDDPVLHYSTETIAKYLAKIRWRIKNNIYFVKGAGAAGYTGRTNFEPRTFKLKKFLFPFYAFSIFLPLADSCYLAMTRRNVRYLIHLPLVLYVAISIAFHLFMRIIGHTPPEQNYDGTKKILIS